MKNKMNYRITIVDAKWTKKDTKTWGEFIEKHYFCILYKKTKNTSSQQAVFETFLSLILRIEDRRHLGNSNKIFVFCLVFHSICTIFVPDIGLCAMTDIEESYWTSPVRESAKFNVTKGERLKAASPIACIDGSFPRKGRLYPYI